MDRHPHKTGWPWTAEMSIPPQGEGGTEGTARPRITIVTPSYNQGEFIEETIRSVIFQNYPNLEYIIIDGGSSDNTLDIIRKYEPWITRWVSEADGGQSDAINKGFAMATGEWGTWINSDDMLARGALEQIVGHIEPDDKEIIYMGAYTEVDEFGRRISTRRSSIDTLEKLVDIPGQWRNGQANQIGQQGMFFSLSLFYRAGGLNVDNHYSMDYELWGRMLQVGGKIKKVDEVLGIFRIQPAQKNTDRLKTTRSLVAAAKSLIRDSRSWPAEKKIRYLLRIYGFEWRYYYHHLRSIIGIRRRLRWIRKMFDNNE